MKVAQPHQEGSRWLWNKPEQNFEAWWRDSAQAGEATFRISVEIWFDEAGL